MPAEGYRSLLRRYARYAPGYDRRWARYTQATLARTIEALPLDQPLHDLIDVACGTGSLAMLIRKRWPRIGITGVDMTPEMLARARERLPDDDRTTWLLGAAERLPVRSHSFDALTCTNAFHLVRQGPAALAEFRRVLRPGGVAVIVDWCRDDPIMLVRSAVFRIISDQHRQIRTVAEMTHLLGEAGFTVAASRRFSVAGGWGMMAFTARSGRASTRVEPAMPAANHQAIPLASAAMLVERPGA